MLRLAGSTFSSAWCSASTQPVRCSTSIHDAASISGEGMDDLAPSGIASPFAGPAMSSRRIAAPCTAPMAFTSGRSEC